MVTTNVAGATRTGDGRLLGISPDGSHLGFVANQGLWTVNLNGGAPVRLGAAEASPTSVTWSADDFIYLVSGGTVSRIGIEGGSTTTVSSLAGTSQVFLSVERVPAGKVFLTSVRDADGGSSWLKALDPDSGDLTDIGLEGSDPRYLATGHLLYAAGDRVMAVRFDLGALKPNGIPIAVLDRVGIEGGLMQLGI